MLTHCNLRFSTNLGSLAVINRQCGRAQAACAALVAFALKAGSMGAVDKATDKLDAARKKKLTDMMAEATAARKPGSAAAAPTGSSRPAAASAAAAAEAPDGPLSPRPGQAITARVGGHYHLTHDFQVSM